MKYNTVFTEGEKAELKDLIDQMVSIRTALIATGLDPTWGAVKSWEFAKVVYASKPLSGDKVLDIGSKVSVLPFYLQELGCDVSAVDIDLPVDYLDYYRAKNIEYCKATICDLPFSDSIFDYVYSVCVLEHIYPWSNDEDVVRETINAFREIARVIKPGGITAHTCDFYVMGFDTWRTYHAELLYRIIERLKEEELFEPLDTPNYEIKNPLKYYINNSTIYEKPEQREGHLKYLREGKRPANLFTYASIVLRRM